MFNYVQEYAYMCIYLCLIIYIALDLIELYAIMCILPTEQVYLTPYM